MLYTDDVGYVLSNFKLNFHFCQIEELNRLPKIVVPVNKRERKKKCTKVLEFSSICKYLAKEVFIGSQNKFRPIVVIERIPIAQN